MKKIILIILGLVTIGFTACKPDEEPKPQVEPESVEPTNSSLRLTISHNIGANDMVYNENIILPSSESAQVSRLSYILGHFYLINDNNEKVLLNDQYALIDAQKGNESITLTDIPFGRYTSIGFSLGLDSATNHGNPNQYSTDHPLSPINNSLHWGWLNGYIFTALEGKTAGGESFVFHLAGAQNRLDFEMATSIITTAADTSKEAMMTYDINEIFQNPEIYTISTDGASSHSTTSPVTVKLIGNMADVFSDFRVTK
jgi:hypothetical protein|tara:strand:- start:2127 stop:2897 length:771 start_codon:yes stop_codon:yes gene_type:complete